MDTSLRALRAPRGRRLRNGLLVAGALASVVATNASPVTAAATRAWAEHREGQADYQAAMGRWDTVTFPAGTTINAIHAALLPTGKLLVVAGSGNDRERFAAGTFTSLVWDPATGQGHVVPTPSDMFCAGHAFLGDGSLLVAGGTRAYEVLGPDVTAAAGGVTIRNEDPDTSYDLASGTVLTAPDGRRYATTYDVHVPPAHKEVDALHAVAVHASETLAWARSDQEGTGGVAPAAKYAVAGVPEADARNVYAMGEPMTMDKQDFQGSASSWVFDPDTEQYRRTGDMNRSRWYPTLVGVDGGGVLAVSGLDEQGRILTGQNETYDPATGRWTERPGLERYFPTYPSLFRLTGDRLFYSGSSTGYGPADAGRQPGVWGLADDSWTDVPGLPDAATTETSSSVLLAPAQQQKVMIMGGGGVGESSDVTARTAVADLSAAAPAYTRGPDLLAAVRYPSAVTLPDDSVLITGGSSDYRGKHGSDVLAAQLYHPQTGTITTVAPPHVGRDYHSEALLLPDGRVVTMGSNPLFADADDTAPGTFEQRVEIYTPAYLLGGRERPVVADAPAELARGGTADITTTGPATDHLRLIRPSAVTHVTDTEQRSVALDVTARGADGHLTVRVPTEEGLLPTGWYMLFAVDGAGVPSTARWVHVG